MTDEQLDRLIWETLLELGWLIPTTVEAVEIAEAADREQVELPECLREAPVWKLPR